MFYIILAISVIMIIVSYAYFIYPYFKLENENNFIKVLVFLLGILFLAAIIILASILGYVLLSEFFDFKI